MGCPVTNADRPMPANLEAEMALLGALLVNPEYLPIAAGSLDYADFYAAIHASIFRAIALLYFRDEKVDKISVSEELRKQGDLEKCGGISYLSQLMDTVQTASSAAYYAKIIREKSVLRQLIEAGRHITESAFAGEHDVTGTITECESLLAVVKDRQAQSTITVPPTLSEQVARNAQKPPLKYGIPYGITALDNRTLGMQPAQITTVGARTGRGKSSLLEHIAIAASSSNRVLFVPMEMGASYTTDRIAARLADKPINDFLRSGRQGVPDGVTQLYDLFLVDDPAVNDVATIEALIDRLKPDVVMLDHLRHLRGWFPQDKRRADLGPTEILHKLHAMALRTGVHLVMAQQLSRPSEKQAPTLSDLRDAGAIEEISDRVLFLHHPFSIPREDTIVEINAAKDRSCGPRLYHVGWRGETMSFYELDDVLRSNPPCCPGTHSPIAVVA